MLRKESEAGDILDIDAKTIATVDAYEPGYINKNLELIVGLQTEPLKRAIMPFGGIRMVETSLHAYDKEMDPQVANVF